MSEGQALRSIERAMAVLDAAAASSEPVTAKALARELGCSLSTAYNLVNTLMAGGYLERADGGYVLGDRVSALHRARVRRGPAAEDVGAVLEGVRRAGGTSSAYYSRFRGGSVVIESGAHAPGVGPESVLPLGPDLHAHATAHGKVLLSGLTASARRRYLEGRGMPRLTGRTITHVARLETQLERVRRRGIAMAVEEHAPGEACVSVPVTAPDGRVLAAVSVAVPVPALRAHRDALVRALQRGARDAARLLAGDGTRSPE
ncbi:IclR family transcriptional regulator [Streptomyces sp. 7N604]|uniref:IclR family transcriptional regulator n=1 Tax=Streptomyces sp. 7N604 TaxID=3457415 RepID=UPI003FD293DF